jgi:hypothetical protein
MRRTLCLLALLPLACHKPAEPTLPPPASPTGAQVTFETTPPGAHVTLDGTPLPEVTPFTRFMGAGEGHHKVVLALDGFEPAASDFLVPLQDYTVTATLAPAPKVSLVTNPPGASVFLDGAVKLAATPGVIGVPSGEHELLFALADHVPLRRRLGAKERPAQLAVTLSRAATVAVTSTPTGAHVLLDGADTGQVTPVVALPIVAGKPHTLEARAEKLRSAATPIKALPPGGSVSVALKLGDLDRAQLQRRRRALEQESSRLTAEQRRLDKRNQGFITQNAGALARDEARAQAIDERLNAIANALADLAEQLDAP